MSGGYHIYDDMKELGLTGFELLIYACVASFSQHGEGCYYGGMERLAARVGCCRRTAQRVVAALIERGLMEKETIIRHNGKYVSLSVVPSATKCPKGSGQNVPKGCDKMSQRSRARVPYEGFNKNLINSPHNWGESAPARANVPQEDDAIFDEHGNAVRPGAEDPSPRDQRAPLPKFTKPTQEEVEHYIKDRNSAVDPVAFWNYYESTGWRIGKAPMKDWHAAVVTWERRLQHERKQRQRGNTEESVFEHNVRVWDELHGTNYHDEIYNDNGNY